MPKAAIKSKRLSTIVYNPCGKQVYINEEDVYPEAYL